MGAAPSLPDPRFRGWQLLRVRVGAHARERRCGRALHPRGRPARGRRDHPRQRGEPGAEERPRAVRTGDGGRSRRRGDAPGGARGAATSGAHRHAPVPVRDVRGAVPRLGPLAAPRGRRLVRRPIGGGARLPGGQVPPARRRDPPRPPAPRASCRQGVGGEPVARGLAAARGDIRVDRPRHRRGRPAAPGRGVHPSPGGRDAEGCGVAGARVPAPARGAHAGAPDLCGGMGGSARGHADGSADPQPGDDDPSWGDRTGIGRHGKGGRAARRCGADPEGAGPPDRRAGGASHLRRRSRRPRTGRVEPGPGGDRCAGRGVLCRVRERRADRQAAAARARRVELDARRSGRRRAGARATGCVGGARARDRGDGVALRDGRLLRRPRRVPQARRRTVRRPRRRPDAAVDLAAPAA